MVHTGDTSIAAAWPQIPADVVTWFRDIFAEPNRRVCERLVNVPNIRETSLDDGLIEALIPDSAPRLLPSGAIVRMDTHNIGGLRRLGTPHWGGPHVRRWETADIAILVFIYRGETLSEFGSNSPLSVVACSTPTKFTAPCRS